MLIEYLPFDLGLDIVKSLFSYLSIKIKNYFYHKKNILVSFTLLIIYTNYIFILTTSYLFLFSLFIISLIILFFYHLKTPKGSVRSQQWNKRGVKAGQLTKSNREKSLEQEKKSAEESQQWQIWARNQGRKVACRQET